MLGDILNLYMHILSSSSTYIKIMNIHVCIQSKESSHEWTSHVPALVDW